MEDEKPVTEATEPLSEDDQKRLGLEWFSAMWTEALERGITPQTMVTVCLTKTINQFVSTYGEDGAARLVAELPDQIRAGRFTVTSGGDLQ